MYDVLNLSKKAGVNYSTLKRFIDSNGESTRMSDEDLNRVKKEAFAVFKKLSDKIDNRIEMRKSKTKEWIVSLELENNERWLDTVVASDHIQAFHIACNQVESKVVSSQIKLKT